MSGSFGSRSGLPPSVGVPLVVALAVLAGALTAGVPFAVALAGGVGGLALTLAATVAPRST